MTLARPPAFRTGTAPRPGIGHRPGAPSRPGAAHRPARSLRTSVVIPVKDDAALLARCLRALALQTRAPDEIVVVDNGSSDASADVARAGGAVVVPCLEPGIGAASSRGYDAATGDVILRIDADSVPSPVWVETIVTAFQSRPDVDAFAGAARFTDGPRVLRAPLAAIYLGAYVAVCTPALGHLPLFGSNVAFRRRAWDRVRTTVHRHDARLHDDLDLAFHLGEHHRVRALPGAVVGISMRPFASGRGFGRRVVRGFRTVLLHWPHDFPPVRWERRALRRMLRRP